MLMGRVVGEVWATSKLSSIDGLKLLVVQQMDLQQRLIDGIVVAVDSVGAGPGDQVLVAQGSSARQSPQTIDRPVDAVIMAIIDEVHVEQRDWAAFDAKTVGDLR
jgi:microcompartment protein CcmK/EutM